jgi:DNA-binding beta-propeller fold protein YncE
VSAAILLVVCLGLVVRQAPPAEAGGQQGLTDIAVAGGKIWTADGVGRVASFDAHARAAGKPLHAGRYVFSLASGFGSLWAASDDGLLRRISPLEGTVIDEISADDWSPTQIAVGASVIWAHDSRHDRIYTIDPVTNRPSPAVDVGGRPFGFAASARGLWVMVASRRTTTGPEGRRVIKLIDARTGRLSGPRIRVACDGALAPSDDVLWVTNVCAGTITAYDATSGRRLHPSTHVGREPIDAVLAGGDVWVANHSGDTVAQLSARTGAVSTLVRVPAPTAMAVLGNQLWVISGEHLLTRIDLRTNRVMGKPTRIRSGG